MMGAVLALSACPQTVLAETRRDEATAPDPFEKMNRVFFLANGILDFLVIRPAAIGYKRIAPRPLRTILYNAFSNLNEPRIAINDALQGHGKKSFRTVVRFVLNSTIGVAGLLDVASRGGLPHHSNDFGITLARHGVSSGPYIFLPILGPGTARDVAGYVVDVGLDPFNYFRFPQSDAVGAARTVEQGLDDRASADGEVKRIVATSTDAYASIRSYYLQHREAKIDGGKLSVDRLPDFDSPLTPANAPSPPPPSSLAAPPGGDQSSASD